MKRPRRRQFLHLAAESREDKEEGMSDDKAQTEPEADVEAHVTRPDDDPEVLAGKTKTKTKEEEADVEAHTIVPTIPQP